MKAASARSARSTTPSNRGDFTRGHAIACPFWVKEEAPRSYAGWELCSFVADCINKYAKAGADFKTMFDDIFVLVQGRWAVFKNKSA